METAGEDAIHLMRSEGVPLDIAVATDGGHQDGQPRAQINKEDKMPPREDYTALAKKHAPIFVQKVSDEWRVADQIAPVNFAGGIKDVTRNPEKLYALRDDELVGATVYYSICETPTHYFLLYAVYHVLDWWKRYEPSNLYDKIRDMLDEHIHDMEGALLVITKEPGGLVDAVVTVAHYDFYLYTEPQIPEDVGRSKEAPQEHLRIVKFNETTDGNVWLDKATGRVKLYIQSRGHGIRGDHKSWGGGDWLYYYGPKDENSKAGTLDPGEDRSSKSLDYDLEDIFAPRGLWDHRFDQDVFRQREKGQWGFVYRDKDGNPQASSANPPWSWNDHNDPSPIGEIATDPARFVIRYAQGWGPVSTHYVYNPYQSILGR